MVPLRIVRRRSIWRFIWLTPLLFASLTVFSAGARLPGQSPTAPPRAHHGFQINGTVMNARDGAPIPFARLQATPARVAPAAPEGGNGGRGTARGPGARGAADASTGDAPGAPFFAGQGQPQARGNIATRGRPAEDTSVTADAHGHFVLDLSTAGAWRLTASARGFRTQALDAHEGFSSSVVLTETVPTYTVAFRMIRNASVSGMVFDEAGEPVERAQVQAEIVPPKALDGQIQAPTRVAGNAMTDDRGHYELAALAPGSYHLRVQATPWYAAGAQLFINRAAPQTAPLDPSLDLVYALTWYPGTAEPRAAETLVLGDGEERRADFHLTAIPAVHLQVPIVTPAPADGEGRRFVQNGPMVTRVDGNGFGMNGGVMQIVGRNDVGQSSSLPPGTYQVSVAGGFNGLQDGDDQADVREIEIRPGTTGMVSLADARPLVRVTMTFDGIEDQNPPGVLFTNVETGRQITAFAAPRNQGGRRGGPDRGAAPAPAAQQRTILVPPGRYQVALQSNALYLTGMVATGAHTRGRTVEIVDGSPALTLHVASGRATISGFVHSGERTLPGAMVVLVPVMLGQADAIYATYRDQTNTDGSFLLPAVLPGRYILIAIDHGWDVDWRDPAVLAPYLLHGIPLELAGGAKVTERVTAQLP